MKTSLGIFAKSSSSEHQMIRNSAHDFALIEIAPLPGQCDESNDSLQQIGVVIEMAALSLLDKNVTK